MSNAARQGVHVGVSWQKTGKALHGMLIELTDCSYIQYNKQVPKLHTTKRSARSGRKATRTVVCSSGRLAQHVLVRTAFSGCRIRRVNDWARVRHNVDMNEPQPLDPRRRLRELLAIPERDRTDEQWDEIVELEICLAPGNTAVSQQAPNGQQQFPSRAQQPRSQQPRSQQPRSQQPRSQPRPQQGQPGPARPQDPNAAAKPPRRQFKKPRRPPETPPKE